MNPNKLITGSETDELDRGGVSDLEDSGFRRQKSVGRIPVNFCS